MEIHLMLGVAGSGKSTYVNNMVSKSAYPFQILCLDDIRLALGDVYDIRTEPVVRMISDVMGRAYMERKLPIVVDSTCSSLKIAEMWCRLAKKYGYETHGIYLDTPFDVCCDRRVEKIAMEVLIRQRDGVADLLQFTDNLFDKFKIVKYKKE